MRAMGQLRGGELVARALVVLLLYAAVGVLAYEGRVERRAFAEALVWSVDNLPENWELQTTVDMTNWYSVLKAGELAPRNFTIEIQNSNQAQFYRIR